MDPITTAIATTIATGVLTDLSKDAIKGGIKDSYKVLIDALKKKPGSERALADAVNELENNPNSEESKAALEKEVICAKVNDDPEVLKFAQDLLNKIKEQPGKQKIISQTQNNTMSGVNVSGNVEFKPVQSNTITEDKPT